MAISRKRETNARRPMPKAALAAVSIALVVTASVVTIEVAADQPPAEVQTAATSDVTEDIADRDAALSRSGSRTGRAQKVEGGVRFKPAYRVDMSRAAIERAVRGADERRWTTAPLNLWSDPGANAENLGLVDEEEKVSVTGRRDMGRDEIVVDGRARWVTAGYLDDTKPVVVRAPAPAESADSGGASSRTVAPAATTCNNGTSVSNGVSPNIVAVHEAVCAAFPEITTYGTLRADGEHSQGLAVDIMVSGSRGQEVADFVRDNYGDLGVNYVMHAQQIWSVDRSGEGWRYVEDRGSDTANHYDHVHVTTY